MPGCTNSLACASVTGNLEISASCNVNCLVKAAGICSTRSTAAEKSLGSVATTRITAAGPPVDAAITTIGNFVAFCEAGAGAFTRDFPFAATGGGGDGALPRGAVQTTQTFAAIF